MLFWPQRTVRVTNEQEFDAALSSADRIVVEGDDELLTYASRKTDPIPETGGIIPSPAAPFKPKKKVANVYFYLLATAVVLLGIALGAYWRLSALNLPPPSVPSSNAAIPPPLEPLSPAPSNSISAIQVLAWPVVTIVAISALFLIARQAISHDRNVTISWKVTEKVSGRLVITKVRTRGA